MKQIQNILPLISNPVANEIIISLSGFRKDFINLNKPFTVVMKPLHIYQHILHANRNEFHYLNIAVSVNDLETCYDQITIFNHSSGVDKRLPHHYDQSITNHNMRGAKAWTKYQIEKTTNELKLLNKYTSEYNASLIDNSSPATITTKREKTRSDTKRNTIKTASRNHVKASSYPISYITKATKIKNLTKQRLESLGIIHLTTISRPNGGAQYIYTKEDADRAIKLINDITINKAKADADMQAINDKADADKAIAELNAIAKQKEKSDKAKIIEKAIADIAELNAKANNLTDLIKSLI